MEASNLTPGNYYVQEINAPNYVEFDSKIKIPFVIKKDDVQGIKLMIPNKLKLHLLQERKSGKATK